MKGFLLVPIFLISVTAYGFDCNSIPDSLKVKQIQFVTHEISGDYTVTYDIPEFSTAECKERWGYLHLEFPVGAGVQYSSVHSQLSSLGMRQSEERLKIELSSSETQGGYKIESLAIPRDGSKLMNPFFIYLRTRSDTGDYRLSVSRNGQHHRPSFTKVMH